MGKFMNINPVLKQIIASIMVLIIVFLTSITIKEFFLKVPDANEVESIATEFFINETGNNSIKYTFIWRNYYETFGGDLWEVTITTYDFNDEEKSWLIKVDPISGKIISSEQLL